MKGIFFTTTEASGAWPNGSRVVKVAFEEGDTHAIGDLATVIGSLGPLADGGPLFGGNRYGYFVVWDDRPDLPVFVGEKKIALESRGGQDA
jgi:hypothetical protein